MKLSLAEGIYLIALDDEEGRLLASAEKSINKGLISSAILELAILKKIALTGGKINVSDASGTGNKVLDDILANIGAGGEISTVVEGLCNSYKSLQEDITDLLVNRGIIKREATKVLWIPVSERMDNANYAYEQEIRNNIRSVVIEGAKPTPAFIVISSIIFFCDLLEEVFPNKDELIDAVKATKDNMKSPALGPDIAHALEVLKKSFGK